MASTSSATIKSIRDLEITGKTVFMRVDFNVPLSEPNSKGECEVEDDNRIVEALPTIKYAIEKGAKLVLASHLGRPDGKRKPEFSLLPCAKRLSQLIGQEVTMADDCIGDGIELMVKGMRNGQVLLLENLRFHSEEEANDSGFSSKLARLGQIYINDAFGTAHRKHASTYGVAVIAQQKGMGFLIEKELKYLDPLLQAPQKPFYAILGGAKVSDKIKTIHSLLTRVDGLLIGGAMANAFLIAQGQTIPAGAKQPKPEDIEHAKAILKEAGKKEMTVLLPEDTNQGFDIGPKTVKRYSDVLTKAKTVFWNGPLGMFEKDEYAKGTSQIAEALSKCSAVKVVGGADTGAAIKKSGCNLSAYDHISTGGGAVLEYLEGKGLPGIDILKVDAKRGEVKPL